MTRNNQLINNKNIVPLFNISNLSKNKNLMLQSSNDNLNLNMVPLNNKLFKINNSINKLHLNSNLLLNGNTEIANRFYYFLNTLIRKNELYSLRIEFNNLVYRINNLINIFYIFNNVKELNSFNNRKLNINIKENLNIFPNKILIKTLFIPRNLIKISYIRSKRTTNNNFQYGQLFNNSNLFDIAPLNNKANTNFNYKFIYNNNEYLNLSVLQQKYIGKVNYNNDLKYQLILDKNELNYLLNKLNELHISIQLIIENLNRFNDLFKINKISLALKTNSIVELDNNQELTNINNNISIKNLSLLECYELFNNYSIEKKENNIFNLIPYIYNINSDSKINLYNFYENNYNYINYSNNLNNINNKENKIKIEETMKAILNKYSISSSNEWFLKNNLNNSKLKYINNIENLNNIDNKEINISRKDFVFKMINYLVNNNNIDFNALNNNKISNFNWIKNSINDFYNNNNNNNNLDNNIIKGLDNKSPVTINYYKLNKYSTVAKGFILNKLLDNNNINNKVNNNLIEEVNNEYKNWILISKRPVINQYLKSMSIYNNRKKGTFIYFTNIFNYSFIKYNNKMIKNIYKLFKLVFKNMYSLISKPVYFITPNKIIIHLFYFLLVPKFKSFNKYNIIKNNKLKLKTFNNKFNNLKYNSNSYLPGYKSLVNLSFNNNNKHNNNNNLVINKLNSNLNKDILNFINFNKELINKINNLNNYNKTINKIKNIIIKINFISKLIISNYSNLQLNEKLKMDLRLKLVSLYRIKNRLFLIFCLPINLINNISNNNNNELIECSTFSIYSNFYNANTILNNSYLNNNSNNSKRYNIFFKNHINKLNLIKLFKDIINSNGINKNDLINNNELNKGNISVSSLFNYLNSENKNKYNNIINKNNNLKLNYILNLKKKQNNKINKLFRNRRLNSYFNYNLRKKIKLIKLYNVSLINLYPNKFEKLCNILNYCFKKNVVIDLTRIHYPYNDANILVNMLAIMIKKISFNRITNNLFKNIMVKNVNNILYFNNINFLPAFLTGLRIKLGGKVINFKSKGRDTVKVAGMGSSSPGKINYNDFARYTSKHKRGAFSISVSNGQNFY